MKILQLTGITLCFLITSVVSFAQAGSTFSNPEVINALPYTAVGDSTCGYGDNYTTADIACTGSYMNGDEKIYSFTPSTNYGFVNITLSNISDSWSGMYVTDDSTTAGNCLGDVGSSTTNDKSITGLSLVSGTTYYIIVSTYASPQCISSYDITIENITCPDPSALGVTDISYDSVVLDWTENGSATTWQIEWDTAGFTQGTGNILNTSSNPDTIVVLPSTDYSYYVRSVCGPMDSSSWVGPFNFTTLPTCPEPSNLGVSAISSTGATISWTENGAATLWQYELDTAGFTPGTGTIDTTSSNPKAISGLTAGMDYEFYVRTVCGAGDSSVWVGPFSFTTFCNPFIAPYTESFDSAYTPDCWSQSAVTGGPWEFTGSPDYGAASATDHTGNGGTFAWMDQSSSDEAVSLISNDVDVSALTTPFLRFFYYTNNTNGSQINDLIIEAWTGSAWSEIDSLHVNDGGWTAYGYDLSSFTFGSNLVRVRFRAESGGASDDYYQDQLLDDVSFMEMPNCLDPGMLVASNVTSNSADLGWTENGSATLWQYEFDTAGFTQGTGTIDTTSSNPFNATGLMSQTDYEFYVRAVCGPGDTSAWAGPVSFTTTCATYAVPHFEPFDSFLPSICWDEADNGTPATGPSSFGSGSWGQSGFTGSGSGGARTNLYTTGKEDWIISPIFDLSAGGPYELKLEVAVADYGSGGASDMGSDDTVQVLISNDGGATWIAIHTFDDQNTPSHLGEFANIDLTGYTSANTQFAIWASEGSTDDSEDYYFYVGSFEIHDLPSCVDVSSLSISNLTTTSVDLTWTENGAASLWEYEYDTSGFTLGSGMGDTTSTNPASISSLTGDTWYQFYVRSICGPGDTSAWVGPMSFYTGHCVPNPSSVDGDGIVNVTMGGINNSTSAEPGNYGNYSSLVAVGPQGGTLNIDITLATGYTYDMWAWVDWNDDLDFSDPGEEFFLGTSTSSNPTVFSSSIAIPATATLGNHRIRIGGADGGLGTTSPSDPCYTGSYGSFEDYTLNVVIPMVLSTSGMDVSCNGLADGTASVSVTNGTTPYSYVWSNGDTTMMADSLSAGSYYVTVTDNDGQEVVDTVMISEPAALLLTMTVDSNATCFGSADGGATVAIAGGTAPYSINWVTGDTTSTIDGLIAGTFTLSISDANGCIATDSVTITQGAPVVVNLGADTTVCYGDNVTLDAGSGFNSYTWSNGDVTQSTTVMTSMAGTMDYSVTVTDLNGCTGEDTINVVVNPPVVVEITGDLELCANESGSIMATTGFASYVWNNGETTESINVDASTLGTGIHGYSVTVTDAFGCTGDTTNDVEVYPAVVVDLGPDTSIIWFGSDTVYTLDAGSGFDSYSWSTGDMTQTVDITTANQGTIHVTVMDSNQCTGSDTVVVDFILSVNNIELSTLKMYPNPTSDVLNIELGNLNTNEAIEVAILSVTGEVVLRDRITNAGNTYQGVFDVSHLANGTYFLQLEVNGKQVIEQFIVK